MLQYMLHLVIWISKAMKRSIKDIYLVLPLTATHNWYLLKEIFK